MTKSQTSRLAVIAVIATSLLAVGVVTAISMTEQADAQLSVTIRNRISQSNTNSVDQTATATSSGGAATASNTASTTQSNSATITQSND